MLHKQPELDEGGNPVYDAEGKQRYRCGFRIGGGIDQDPLKSPQGYPDRVKTVYKSRLLFLLFKTVKEYDNQCKHFCAQYTGSVKFCSMQEP